MTRLGLAAALIGFALALYLIVDHGAAAVMSLMAQGGLGLIAAALFHIVPMALNAEGWRILVPGRGRPGLAAMTTVVWLRESVNGLLPVARVGGELVSIRVLALLGQSRSIAVASLVVDLTIGVISQLALTLGAVAILLSRGIGGDLAAQIALALSLGLPLMLGAYLVQRAGAFERLARLFDRAARGRFPDLVGASARIDRSIHAMYRRRGRIGASVLWQVAGWIAGGGEIWIALLALGAPVSFLDAVMLEALIQALSSAAFVVPGALGVQEGGFVLFGGFFGLAPEAALALALSRRLRDVVVFGPGLLVLPLIEGRRLWRRARRSQEGG